MEGLKRNHLLVITAILGLVMQVIAQNNSTIHNSSPSPKTNSVNFNTSSLIENSATSPSQNSSTQSKMTICSTATPSRKPGCQSEAFYLQCVFTEGQVLDLLTVSAIILAFVILLLSTAVLSCKLCFLKRRSGGSRPTRTNVDLVAGQSYRPQGSGGGGASEPGKEAGLSETSMMMAELQPQPAPAPAEKEQAEGGPANGTQDPGSAAAADSPESNSAAPPEEPSPPSAEEIADVILVV